MELFTLLVEMVLGEIALGEIALGETVLGEIAVRRSVATPSIRLWNIVQDYVSLLVRLNPGPIVWNTP